MLLNDIGKSPDTTFRKINQHLEANYGFKIAEDSSDKDLVAIMEQIEEEITELKVKGDDAKASPEISKRLLVLEGIRTLREFAILQFQSPHLEKVVKNLIDFVVDDFTISGNHHGGFDESVKDAMKQYRSSKYRFPDDAIEQRVRQGAMSRIQALSQDEGAVDESPMFEEADEPEVNSDINGIDEANRTTNSDDFDWHQDLEKQTKPPGDEEQAGMVRGKDGKWVKDPWKEQQAARRKGIVMKEDDLEETVRAGFVKDARLRRPENQAERNLLATTAKATRAANRGSEGAAAAKKAEYSPYAGAESGRDWTKGGFPTRPQTPHGSAVYKKNAPGDRSRLNDPNSGKNIAEASNEHAGRTQGKEMKEHANLVKNLRRLLETEVSQAEVMMAAKGFAQELQEMIEKIGRLQNEDLPPVTDQMRETYGNDSSSAFQTQIYGALQGVMDSLYTAKGQVDDAVGNMAATGQVSAETDMDVPVDGMDAGGMGVGADLDNIAGDLDAEPEMDAGEMGDEFGAEDEEEPLGREMKESRLQRKVLEMKKLVEKARTLRSLKV